VDSSITTPLANNLPPNRAGIFIDLVNCWNQMSREAALETLESEPHFHALVPIDLMVPWIPLLKRMGSHRATLSPQPLLV
jgi:hypothetical protein